MIEALAVLRRVESLPAEPGVLRHARAVHLPLDPRVVRARERQRLDLQRRQQAVRPHQVGAGTVVRDGVEGAEDDPRRPGLDGQADDRPPLLQEPGGPESMVDEQAAPKGRSFAQRHIHGDDAGGPEQRFAVAEPVEELRVVAVDHDVGQQGRLFLGRRRRRIQAAYRRQGEQATENLRPARAGGALNAVPAAGVTSQRHPSCRKAGGASETLTPAGHGRPDYSVQGPAATAGGVLTRRTGAPATFVLT